jgi:glutaredoxin/glutathione-dependent peroxiredoxin
MTIKIGDRIPSAELRIKTEAGQQKLTTEEVFGGKKVVLIGVPGAFTPTCSMNHLPGFILACEDIKAKGVDTIACLSVNDAHVMKAWGEASGADGKVLMLADPHGAFTRALGLEMESADLGRRSRRYSMLVEDGVVKQLNVEDKPGVNVSGPETILAQL